MHLLSWKSLVFLIPIGVGTALAIGAAFAFEAFEAGGADHPAGIDPGHGAGPVDNDAADSVPDVGRIPLTIRLMLASLTFGGTGLCVTYLLGAEGGRWGTLLAAGAGLWTAFLISGSVARLFARRLPLLESETITRRDLLGSTGRAVLALGPDGGLVQVHDRRGNLHQVPCRTFAGEPTLAAGAEVLLVDYDDQLGLYRATISPVDPRS